MKVQHKRKIISVLIILSAFIGMGLLASMKPEPPKKPIVNKAMFVEVLNLKPSDITFEIKSQGTVKPKTETTLSAEVSGRIIAISEKFIAGGLFKKDDILMEIDPTDYIVAVTQADAFLKQRQIEYNGSKSLQKKGYRAEAELAASKASLAAAKAALVRAEKNLERTKIRLPYDGLVRTKDSDIGQFVNPGTKLGSAFATDIAEIRLALTDNDLAFLDLPETGFQNNDTEIGPAVILSAIRKGKYQEWSANIIRTEGVVDERSRVSYAVVQLDDPYRLSIKQSTSKNNNPLPIGTFVGAKIQGKSFSNVLTVPRTAVRGKNQLMFIDIGNRLQIKEVDILRADSKYAYILQNTNSDNRISITAIESPINGMKVRTTDRQQIIDEVVVKNTSTDNTDTKLQTQTK
ncbi:MAG: RND family efflux transporter MFP subunit [Enterobacterales bacterium]|jgi:RND family efflux transporter MFP subunit